MHRLADVCIPTIFCDRADLSMCLLCNKMLRITSVDGWNADYRILHVCGVHSCPCMQGRCMQGESGVTPDLLKLKLSYYIIFFHQRNIYTKARYLYFYSTMTFEYFLQHGINASFWFGEIL